MRTSLLPLSSAALPLLLLPLAAHAAWLGPLAARSPPAPHAAASRAPAPVLLDYIKESHDWETSQTPFDYSQDADWLAEGVEVVRSQNPTMLPLLTRLRDAGHGATTTYYENIEGGHGGAAAAEEARHVRLEG